MSLIDAPTWYWICALAVSVWQAIRGCWYYHAAIARSEPFVNWRTRDRVVVLYVQSTWLHFISSLAGFAALAVAYRLVTGAPIGGVSAGQAALIALSFLFGFVGVSGELPQRVQQGKLPGSR